MSARSGARPSRAGGAHEAHRPRRRFAQNFLVDTAVVDRIVRTVAPRADDRIVEIGPGQGALTAPLSERVAELVAVEIDRDLARSLERRFAREGPAGQPVEGGSRGDRSVEDPSRDGRSADGGSAEGRSAESRAAAVRILAADALRTNFAQLFDDDAPFRVVGNLPYNISTPMIFHLLGFAGHVVDAHFMLQDEVVTRLAAAPGQKARGRLSVMVQYHCRVESLFGVSQAAFSPRPQIRSRIVRLVPFETPPHPATDYRLLAQVVRAAFSQRRKTLRNALKSVPGVDALGDVGIDFSARPETLAVSDFVAIANALAVRQQTNGAD